MRDSLDSLVDRYSTAIMSYQLNMRDGNKRAALRDHRIVEHTRIELLHYGWTDADHEAFMDETRRQVNDG